MNTLMIVCGVLFAFSSSAFAQMNTGHGGGMMNGGWGWGMNSGGFFIAIIAIIVVLGVVIMMRRK